MAEESERAGQPDGHGIEPETIQEPLPPPGRDGVDDPLMWFPAEGERRPTRRPPVTRNRLTRPRLWWSVGTLALLLLAAAVAVWAIRIGAVDPPAPTGSLTVESDPPGAEVWVDGQSRGITPLTFTLDAGAHLIAVRAGAAQREIRRRIEPGARVYEYVDLPQVPDTGRLTVASRPPGARVLVDGELRGVAPLEVEGLSVGPHTVSVTDGVATAQETITVQAGVTASLVVPLAAVGAGNAGWIAIPSVIVLQIFEGGALVGTSESERIMVASGRHTFELRNDALGFRATQQVNVTPGRVARVAVALPNGTLHVNAVPWAEVLLDGRSLGETPLANLQIPIGPHELVFRHPQYAEQRRAVTVSLTAPTRLGVDMRR